MARIGEPHEIITIEPIPTTVPVEEPSPTPAPAPSEPAREVPVPA